MYYRYNREKRNHAAILYHLLLSSPENLERFVELLGHKPLSPLQEAEMYYEYAFLKDHWYTFKGDNNAKRNYLLERLPEELHSTLAGMDILEWNRFFAARPAPSSIRYQSPARWSPGTMAHGMDRQVFARICKLKWCFNVKPDLVIVTGPRQAICIECQLGAQQSRFEEPNPAYPELDALTEMQCHRYMFEHLMDNGPWQVSYALLRRKHTGTSGWTELAWSDVFNRLDASASHPFVAKWLEENRELVGMHA